MKARNTFHYRDHSGRLAVAYAGQPIPPRDMAGLRDDPRVEAERADVAGSTPAAAAVESASPPTDAPDLPRASAAPAGAPRKKAPTKKAAAAAKRMR